MIYLSGMASIIPLLLCLVLAAAQPAGKPGPWKSLFDGKSLDAWRIFKTDRAPKMCETPGAKDCWEIKDGVLQKDSHANDIASKEQFGDFELELEWKIGDASNSGVFYRGTDEFNQIYWSAPEYQLLDNLNAADNKKDNHLAGSVYDLFAVPKDAAKPANEWNQTRIIAKGKHVEHWLNGKKVASYDVGSPDWDAAIKASKFSPEKYPNFGRAPKGYLGIQGDHPGTLALRNIRIRELR
jgi:3-keto-disaccharide hydrolase